MDNEEDQDIKDKNYKVLYVIKGTWKKNKLHGPA